MNGQVCVVTGGTSGIGKAAATALARLGAQVLLAGRDRGRAEAAAAQIGSVSTLPPKVEIADLASLPQVRSLAGRLAALERIDVLINNAELRRTCGGPPLPRATAAQIRARIETIRRWAAPGR